MSCDGGPPLSANTHFPIRRQRQRFSFPEADRLRATSFPQINGGDAPGAFSPFVEQQGIPVEESPRLSTSQNQESARSFNAPGGR